MVDLPWSNERIVLPLAEDAELTRRVPARALTIEAGTWEPSQKGERHVLETTTLARLDLRLYVLFWDLADRFGNVQWDGFVVPLRLPHEILAGFVCRSSSLRDEADGSR